MRIGLLLSGLDRPLTGVTRVALELARALAQRDDCEVVFLTTYATGPLRDGWPADSVRLPGCGRVPGLIALGGPLIAAAARRLRLDVVHDPVGASPFTLGRWAGSFRRVLTVHDAIAFRFPGAYSRSNAMLHRRFVPATLRNVDGVITVSEAARADLNQALGLRPERTWVVPNGVGVQFRPVEAAQAEKVAARYGLARPYLLYVGTQQPRKNLGALITAFGRHRASLGSHQLVLIGPTAVPDESLAMLIAGLGVSSAVHFLSDVPDDDLPALYAAATAFVFPSLMEGFGLPILEAMACGTPVVSSNASSLPEVAGDAAVLVDARDPDALGTAIAQVVGDAALRQSLRTRGLEHAGRFTWERAADATVDVYRELLSRKGASVRRASGG